MPRNPNGALQLDQPLYDTMQLTAGTNQTFTFFSVPHGQEYISGVTKDYHHTNLVQAASLEKGQTFKVLAFSLNIRPIAQGGAAPTRADARVIHMGSINLTLNGNKSFYRSPISEIGPGCAEMMYFSNITPAATEFNINRSVSASSNVKGLKVPIDIEDQEPIRLHMHIPGTIAAVTDVQFVMHGLLTTIG